MKKLLSVAFILTLTACKFNSEQAALPIFGNRTPTTVNGKTDTIYQTIPAFTTVNQYGDSITNKNLDGNIYVADFFFTTCPSICPTMHRNMLTVFDAFKAEKDIKIISYSIDPKHDSVAVLKKYADKMGVTGNTWWLLQGKKEEIYKLSESYLVGKPKEDARQQFIHDGFFILIDKQKRIRGFYDGTVPEQVANLITDIKKLKSETDQIVK
ncbi:MAG: SCO family protein [Mucilaginibacter sp.]|nr:SCO family protein [Mucilaginibacter sp.]